MSVIKSGWPWYSSHQCVQARCTHSTLIFPYPGFPNIEFPGLWAISHTSMGTNDSSVGNWRPATQTKPCFTRQYKNNIYIETTPSWHQYGKMRVKCNKQYRKARLSSVYKQYRKARLSFEGERVEKKEPVTGFLCIVRNQYKNWSFLL